MNLKALLSISRPRFWIYLLGPFLLGLAGAWYHIQAVELSYIQIILLVITGVYFTLPANLLTYGVNDIHDYEIDKDNPKKSQYEGLLAPESHTGAWAWIAVLNLPFLFATIFINEAAAAGMYLFAFLAIFYSAFPIRAKTIPFIDSLFNILYLAPALVSFGIITEVFPDWRVVLAGALWCMAMHAYSASVDIASDSAAGIPTVATRLGYTNTIYLCLGLYLLATIILFSLISWYALLGLIYAGLMLLSLRAGYSRIFNYYRYFPSINMALGFILFWLMIINTIWTRLW